MAYRIVKTSHRQALPQTSTAVFSVGRARLFLIESQLILTCPGVEKHGHKKGKNKRPGVRVGAELPALPYLPSKTDQPV